MTEQFYSYNGNPNLKPINAPINYTQEQVKEYIKCSQDPLYFIKNYVKLINLKKGLTQFIPYDYQEHMIRTMETDRFVIIKCPRQAGKCLTSINTVKIRNKTTGQIIEMPIGEFFAKCKEKGMQKMP